MDETQEKTMKDLQAELVALGMPVESAELMKTKAQAQVVIDSLRAASVVKKVDSLEEKINPAEEKKIKDSWMNKAQRQIAFWETCSKVRVLVPLEGKERIGVVKLQYSPKEKRDIQVHVSGSVQVVTQNGARYLIPKGKYVEVPDTIADVIQERFQPSEIGQELSVDREDPETGKPIKDQL